MWRGCADQVVPALPVSPLQPHLLDLFLSFCRSCKHSCKSRLLWPYAVVWLQMVAGMAFTPVDIIKERLQARMMSQSSLTSVHIE